MNYFDKCCSPSVFFKVLFTLLASFIAMPLLADVVDTDRKTTQKVETLHVVTTFSILADMVQQIGGEHVSVHALVDWDEDAHVFQPSPDDVKKIAGADLLVLNGLGFEGWLERLVLAADYHGPAVEATKGINLIRLNLKKASSDHDHDHDHGSHKGGVYDPHAWHSLHAAGIYVENITQALIRIDALNASYYLEKQASYLEKLRALDLKIKVQLDSVPDNRKRMVVPHNAFSYLARDYGLYIHSLQGLSTESEASAADLAKIVRLIRSLHIKAIFTENISDKRLIGVVESETDATIEGALVSGALSRELAPSYLEMMEYNSRLIINALTKD